MECLITHDRTEATSTPLIVHSLTDAYVMTHPYALTTEDCLEDTTTTEDPTEK